MISSEPSNDRWADLMRVETERYRAEHPRSVSLARQSAPHFLFGVPLHWMRDWPLPSPLFIERAQGNRLICADGREYLDFCLGDSGAMFGHSPPPVARAIAAQAERGLTAMLPGTLLAEVGQALARFTGLPRWQFTLSASDANRFVLRWARAITGRPKVLVFDGCYHGTVDETLVDMAESGETLTRSSLLGQVQDLAQTTVVVPFNDSAAVGAALARGDIACVLTEPALTNCGLVPPRTGFMAEVQALCRQHGALFVLDETHTLSTGHGGFMRHAHLEPDFWVVGKAIAGGLPCAVYGFTDAIARRMQAAKEAAPDGHSGIGTTLSANLLTLAALQANLDEVMTPAAYTLMLLHAAELHGRLKRAIETHGLPWSVTRLGARMELQFCTQTPLDAAQARAAMNEPLERCLQLFLLNRGVVITPFHNMLLVPPMTTSADLERVVDTFDEFVAAAMPRAAT